jgi:hypothetical protein
VSAEVDIALKFRIGAGISFGNVVELLLRETDTCLRSKMLEKTIVCGYPNWCYVVRGEWRVCRSSKYRWGMRVGGVRALNIDGISGIFKHVPS